MCPFQAFLTAKSICDIILVIEDHLQGHLLGQQVNSKIKSIQKKNLANTNSTKCNIYVL